MAEKRSRNSGWFVADGHGGPSPNYGSGKEGRRRAEKVARQVKGGFAFEGRTPHGGPASRTPKENKGCRLLALLLLAGASAPFVALGYFIAQVTG